MSDSSANKDKEESLQDIMEKEQLKRIAIDATSEMICSWIAKNKKEGLDALERKHQEEMKKVLEANAEIDEALKLNDINKLKEAFEKILNVPEVPEE